MSTPPETHPTAEALQAMLAETEEKLRKLVRHLDQLGRTEFRDRAQRLKQMREQRAELEAEIEALKTQLKAHGQDPPRAPAWRAIPPTKACP